MVGYYTSFYNQVMVMEQTYVKYFYNELPLKNWTMHMHFNPITILYDFLVGDPPPPSPQSIHRFSPPNLYRVNRTKKSKQEPPYMVHPP